MTRDLVTVNPETSVWEAERIAAGHAVRHLLVASRGELVGVLCVCDLGRVERDAAVADCMARPVVTLNDTATLEQASHTMRSCAVGCLPVVSQGDLCGIVTRRDLRRFGVAVDHGLSHGCASCGSHEGVGLDPRTRAVEFCCECLERVRPDPDEDLGTGD
jgi:acetoin utilization protein AcuB